jgi:hypothetical protein
MQLFSLPIRYLCCFSYFLIKNSDGTAINNLVYTCPLPSLGNFIKIILISKNSGHFYDLQYIQLTSSPKGLVIYSIICESTFLKILFSSSHIFSISKILRKQDKSITNFLITLLYLKYLHMC